jgi:glycine cleavage system H protein
VDIPEDLSYTEDHEWVRVDGAEATIGITDFAQAALGDVVFVQLAEPGTRVERGATLGEVESTKSVSEIYAPVGGVVSRVNAALADAPEQLNSEPYAAGWLCVLAEIDDGDLVHLLPAERYRELTAS